MKHRWEFMAIWAAAGCTQSFDRECSPHDGALPAVSVALPELDGGSEYAYVGAGSVPVTVRASMCGLRPAESATAELLVRCSTVARDALGLALDAGADTTVSLVAPLVNGGSPELVGEGVARCPAGGELHVAARVLGQISEEQRIRITEPQLWLLDGSVTRPSSGVVALCFESTARAGEVDLELSLVAGETKSLTQGLSPNACGQAGTATTGSAVSFSFNSDARAFTYTARLSGTAVTTGGSPTVPELEAGAGLSIAECADGGTASIPEGGALTITVQSTSPAYVPVTVVASGGATPLPSPEAQAKNGSPATFVFVVPDDTASLVLAASSGKERVFCKLAR